MKIMRAKGDRRNMFELIYSKHTTLKDDNRLTYFSFGSIVKYPELFSLCMFSILSTASSSINTSLSQPDELGLDWPFVYYVYGAASGLVLVIIVSDFIFQQRMCFSPIFLYASISIGFHVCLLVMALCF